MEQGRNIEISRKEIMEMLLLNSYLRASITEDSMGGVQGEIICKLYENKISQIQLNNILYKYYNVLKTIYIMDIYTITVDYLLNRNKNIIELSMLDFKNKINIIKDYDCSSNKKVAMDIRNAYVHNNDLSKNKFKLYNDSTYKVDIRESSLVATFNFYDVSVLVNYLNENARNNYYLNVEGCIDFDLDGNIEEQIDEIYITYYPLKNEMPIDIIKNNLSIENLDRSSKSQILLASKKNQQILKELLKHEIESKDGFFDENNYIYRLDSYQKEKLKEIILGLKNNKSLFQPLEKDNVSFYITFAVHSVLPIPQVHLMRLFDIYDYLKENFSVSKSYSELLKFIENRLTEEHQKILLNILKNQNVDTRCYYSEYRNYLRSSNLNEMKKYSFINVIKYFVSNLIQDDKIFINNKEYEVEKIRNSLVHFRFFLGTNDDIVLYDADPRHVKLCDFNYCEKINIYLLLEECRQKFLKMMDENKL